MDLKDKRLIEKMGDVNYEKSLKEINASIQDVSDKFVDVEITHEPIKLLEKLKAKKIAKLQQQPEVSLDDEPQS